MAGDAGAGVTFTLGSDGGGLRTLGSAGVCSRGGYVDLGWSGNESLNKVANF